MKKVLTSTLRRSVATSLLVPILLACRDSLTALPDDRLSQQSAAPLLPEVSARYTPEVNAGIAQLRRLVAHFQKLEDAMAAGYNVQITGCLELPGTGAMGFHYGNPAFINNDFVTLLEPELLLYEPQKNGRMRFVGVEYIIPFSELPETATAPVLLGQTMAPNTGAGLWALHVWVGRENPTGIFQDWNPNVSCEFAP